MQNSNMILTSDDDTQEDDNTSPYKGITNANDIRLNDNAMDIEPFQKTVCFEIPEPSPEPSPERSPSAELIPVSEQTLDPSPEPQEPLPEMLECRMNISFLCNPHCEDPKLRQSTISEFFSDKSNSVQKRSWVNDSTSE